MIKEAILSISITLFYSTNDVVSIHTVNMPVSGGIEVCEKMKKDKQISLFVVQPIEMDGMGYRVKASCSEVK